MLIYLSKIPSAPRLKRNSSSFPIKTYLLALSFKALLVQLMGLLRYEMIEHLQSSFPTSRVKISVPNYLVNIDGNVLYFIASISIFHPRVVYNLMLLGPFCWPLGFLLGVYGVECTLGTLVIIIR